MIQGMIYDCRLLDNLTLLRPPGSDVLSGYVNSGIAECSDIQHSSTGIVFMRNNAGVALKSIPILAPQLLR